MKFQHMLTHVAVGVRDSFFIWRCVLQTSFEHAPDNLDEADTIKTSDTGAACDATALGSPVPRGQFDSGSILEGFFLYFVGIGITKLL
jgi:hypothetical protein